jgi:hypothetical protein
MAVRAGIGDQNQTITRYECVLAELSPGDSRSERVLAKLLEARRQLGENL